MKLLYYVGVCCILSTFSLCDETKEPPTIKTLIAKVQNAPDHQKRRLINQLKRQLKKMRHEKRQKAMKMLKESFTTHGNVLQDQKNRPQACQNDLRMHQPKFRHLQRQQRVNRGQGVKHR